MTEKEFKRNQLNPILMLIAGIFFGITAILKLAMENPLGYVTIIAAILFFVNSIWMLSTPILIINKHSIAFNETLFRKSFILVHNIKSIDFEKNFVLIHTTNNDKTKIRLNVLKYFDRKDFIEALKTFKQEKEQE